MISNKKILITGGTGQLVSDAVETLASDNEVWCLARFTDPAAKASLEERGVRTFKWETGVDSLDGLPRDFSFVLHAAKGAIARSDDAAITTNCTGVAQLMTHCAEAEAFAFISTTAVYTPQAPDHVHVEGDPTGGYSPHDPSYAISKIAAEGTARALSQTLSIPTVVARMNIAYGPRGWGGLPMHYYRHLRGDGAVPVIQGDGATCMTPIHSDDITRQIPLLWTTATVPARVVNWGGDDVVSERELIEWMAGLTGREARLVEAADARAPCAADGALRKRLIGECQVHWREGIASAIDAHFPGDLVG